MPRLRDLPSAGLSPYLAQHVDNPVEWWLWGEDAFDEARRRDVPVFLSVGYAACHWCHVMAHESFEDEQVAAFLNAYYVSIKVDREERPDLDDLYRRVVSEVVRERFMGPGSSASRRNSAQRPSSPGPPGAPATASSTPSTISGASGPGARTMSTC